MKWLINFLLAIVAIGGGAYGWLQFTDQRGGVSFVQINPEKASIKVGEQITLEVNAKNGQQIYIPDAKVSNWASLNSTFASVSSDGTIIGLIPGDTEIKGNFRGYKITVPVKVFSKNDMVSALPGLRQNTIKLIRLPLDGALIYIFTQKENHRSCAEKLKNLINKTNATVFVSSNMVGPDRSDIRYYSDKPEVKKSVELICEQLRSYEIIAKPRRMKKGIWGWFQISSELIEVWFGKNDTCKKKVSKSHNSFAHELAPSF